METPESTNGSLNEIASAAAARLPELVALLRSCIDGHDPVQLLSALTLRHQIQDKMKAGDPDEFARWQARLEFITWLIGSTPDSINPTADESIGSEPVDAVELALVEFWDAASMAVLENDPELDSESNSLRALIRTEAMHVRGEGPPAVIKYLAVELYGPHGPWFHRTLGFDINQAIAVIDAVDWILGERLNKGTRAAGLNGAAPNGEPQYRTTTDPAAVLGLRVEEVIEALPDVSQDAIRACLTRLSADLGTLSGPPDLLAFNPLVRTPFLRRGEQFFLFAPALRYDALISSFHFDLLADDDYRKTYDAERTRWLERAVMASFHRVWPDAKADVNLKYGSKKQRAEIDAVVFYDGFLLLIECKWKALTVSARTGLLAALHTDVKQALNDAIDQAVRASEYVAQCVGEVRFRSDAGADLVIDKGSIREVVLIGITGRGSLSLIAANPSHAAALGLLKFGQPPWMLSLLDLMTVSAAMEFEGQLIDYVRRRTEALADGRFHVHDELDWLDMYFAGALDIHDPQFREMNLVSFTTSGEALERVLLSNGEQRPDEVRRKLTPRIRQLLRWIEEGTTEGRTDLVASILRLSDRQLAELSDMWDATERRTLSDGRMHDCSGVASQRATGFTVVTGAGHLESLADQMAGLSILKKYEARAESWFGIASDVRIPNGPFSVFFELAPWKPDLELEKIIAMKRPRDLP